MVLLSLCLDIVDTVVVLYLYLVKLLLALSDVFFFFFLLCYKFVVNEDEYINNNISSTISSTIQGIHIL